MVISRRRRNSWQPSRVLVLVANAGGVDAAKRLVMHFGGRRMYVPLKDMADNHELVVGIGRRAANALRDEFGGSLLVVPIGRDLKLDIAAAAVENAKGGARQAIVREL